MSEAFFVLSGTMKLHDERREWFIRHDNFFV
jgi:mannose-6-phosphate isomerase-like protein (cupin superfamily)